MQEIFVIDAHYYALLALCRTVGFKKEAAHIIAYASQFVDDAKINHIIPEKMPPELSYTIINDKPSFFNMATSHRYFRLQTYNYNAMINNIAAFHFVPGCDGKNFPKKMRCKKESPVIMAILEDAKQSGDLVKLGTVLHVYADSFSHQGFSGILSKVNDIKNCENIKRIYDWNVSLKSFAFMLGKLKGFRYLNKVNNFVRTMLPPYGHGQAFFLPDIPYMEWKYEFDFSSEFSDQFEKSEVNNNIRFKDAFNKMKYHLEEFSEMHPEYKMSGSTNVKSLEIEELINNLLKEASLKKRISNWKRILVEQNMLDLEDSEIIDYDETLWLKKAFTGFEEKKFNARKVEGVSLSSEFKNTNWYRFYLAVKWYKEKFHMYTRENDLKLPC